MDQVDVANKRPKKFRNTDGRILIKRKQKKKQRIKRRRKRRKKRRRKKIKIITMDGKHTG